MLVVTRVWERKTAMPSLDAPGEFFWHDEKDLILKTGDVAQHPRELNAAGGVSVQSEKVTRGLQSTE